MSLQVVCPLLPKATVLRHVVVQWSNLQPQFLRNVADKLPHVGRNTLHLERQLEVSIAISYMHKNDAVVRIILLFYVKKANM